MEHNKNKCNPNQNIYSIFHKIRINTPQICTTKNIPDSQSNSCERTELEGIYNPRFQDILQSYSNQYDTGRKTDAQINEME